MSLRDEALEMHRRNKGKLAVSPKVKVTNKEELSLAYSPGVAEPCKEIHENPRKVFEYTMKSNTVAVVTDGTAVYGTAIVTVAGMINALRIVDKDLSDIKVVLNGAGAAGIAIVKLLYSYGVRDMICVIQKALFTRVVHLV